MTQPRETVPIDDLSPEDYWPDWLETYHLDTLNGMDDDELRGHLNNWRGLHKMYPHYSPAAKVILVIEGEIERRSSPTGQVK